MATATQKIHKLPTFMMARVQVLVITNVNTVAKRSILIPHPSWRAETRVGTIKIPTFRSTLLTFPIEQWSRTMVHIFTKTGLVFVKALITLVFRASLALFALSNWDALLFLSIQAEWALRTFFAGVVARVSLIANAVTKRW